MSRVHVLVEDVVVTLDLVSSDKTKLYLLVREAVVDKLGVFNPDRSRNNLIEALKQGGIK